MKKLNIKSLYFLLVCENPKLNYGKDCPDNDASRCLNENTQYDSFSVAWKKCSEVLECAFVMRYSDGKFLLRRESDPNVEGDGIWGFNHACPSK